MKLSLIVEGAHWKKWIFTTSEGIYYTHIQDLQEWSQSEGNCLPKPVRPRKFSEALIQPLDKDM